MKQPRPTIHGRDHKGRAGDGSQGGADPAVLNVDSTENVGDDQGVHSYGPIIEGYVLTATGDSGSDWRPSSSASFSQTVLGFAADVPGSLLGYWRLGDSGDPWADISGLSPDSPMHLQSGTNALTADVTGALSSGQDDGAVHFDGRDHTTTGEYIKTTANGSRFSLQSQDMSVVCWLKPEHNASGSYDGVIGLFIAGATTSRGWGIHYLSSTMIPSWTRAQDGGTEVTLNGPAMTPGEWVFIVGTYSIADGMKLYVDGALADSDATTFNLTAADTDGVSIGHLRSLAAFEAYMQGSVDEASVWGIELTAAQVVALYNASGVATALATPIGTAGGALAGEYPNPGLASSVAGDGLAVSSNVLSVNVDNSTVEIAADTIRVKDGGITSAKIADGTIVNGDVSGAAAIDYSKLDLAGSIAETDLDLSDVTTANATTATHGLLPKLPGDATQVLLGDGTYGDAPGGDPHGDMYVWMPLFDGDGALVLDGDGDLIPTLIPI